MSMLPKALGTLLYQRPKKLTLFWPFCASRQCALGARLRRGLRSRRARLSPLCPAHYGGRSRGPYTSEYKSHFQWPLVLIGVFGFSQIGNSQDSLITLNVKSGNVDVQVQVGESITRDTKSGIVSLLGGVEIRSEDGSLILADQAILQNEPGSTIGQFNTNLDGATLHGRVYLSTPNGIEVQAETLTFKDKLTRFEALGTPVQVISDGQRLTAFGGLLGDIEAQIFYGFGGASFDLDRGSLRGQEVQIDLPENDTTDQVRILATGNVVFRSDFVTASCEHVNSSPDGNQLVLHGGVDVVGPEGAFSSGAVIVDLNSETFTLTAGDEEGHMEAIEFMAL